MVVLAAVVLCCATCSTGQKYDYALLQQPSFLKDGGKGVTGAVPQSKARLDSVTPQRTSGYSSTVLALPAALPQKHAPLTSLKSKGALYSDLSSVPGSGCSTREQRFNLYFATGGTEFAAESNKDLLRISALLRNNPAAAVIIEGHTDSRGDAMLNLSLSIRRAEYVRTLLAREHGISLSRIQALGLGESAPLMSNDTGMGRAKNRRVAIRIDFPATPAPRAVPVVTHDIPQKGESLTTPSQTSSPDPNEAADVPLSGKMQQKQPAAMNAVSQNRVHSVNAPAASVHYTPLPENSKTQSPPPSSQRLTGRYHVQVKTEDTFSAAPAHEATIEIAAVGDIMMGSTWQGNHLPENDGRDLFRDVAPLFQGADVVFGNLEGPLIDDGSGRKCRPGASNCYEFRMPTRYAQHLQRAGFTTLSIANNHAHDFGPQGQESTIDTLRQHGISPAGGEAIAKFNIKNKRIAIAGFAHTGRRYAYPLQDIAGARRIVQRLKQEHNLVIVSFHGGAEGPQAAQVFNRTEYFCGENRGNVVQFAHAVIDAGADLVLGHGPHVLRAMELYKGKLIAYSLGNFLTYKLFNTRGLCGQSVILRLSLDPETGAFRKGSLTPLLLTDNGLPRKDKEMSAVQQVMLLTRNNFSHNALNFLNDAGKVALSN